MTGSMHMMTLVAAVWPAVAALVGSAEEQPAPPQPALLKDVNFEQRLDQQVPIDLTFRNELGQGVTISECMEGRPTVLVPAYYRCPMLCNQVLNGIARSLQAIDLQPGRDFSVVVVSIDPRETVDLAAAKKKAVVRAFDHDSDGAGWHFLVSANGSTSPAGQVPGDPAISAVCDSIGFRYRYDPQSDQFAHASGIVVLTPSGRTSRYYYGIDYPTRDLRLGLVEAAQGQIGSLADQLLLFCFHYDPLTGRYGLAIMRLIRAAGLLTLLGMGTFIVRSLRRERRELNGSLSGARPQ